MKPFVEHLSTTPDESFRYTHFKQSHFSFRWHMHPEYELTLITSGKGRRFIGDNISDYYAEDLVFLGGELPHSWFSKTENQGVVIQFHRNFLGKAFFDTPELLRINHFLDNSLRGFSFSKKTITEVAVKMLRLEKEKAFERILTLMEIFKILSDSDYTLLSTRPFKTSLDAKVEKRIDKVCNYINQKFTQPLTLKEISDIASMSPQSFCRFFKSTTGKSFIDYLTELRIGKACTLLVESEKSISEICFAVGFNNVSNFNRRFQRAKNRTPSEYRKEYSGTIY